MYKYFLGATLGLLFLLSAPTVYTGIFSPGGLNALPFGPSSTKPSGPVTGTLFYVTDGSSSTDCTGGGGNLVPCIFNGTDWVNIGSGGAEVDTLDTVFDRGKVIDGANSLANAARIGDGTTPICLYTDATLGPQVRPCTDANVKTIIPTNFTWSLYDIEGAANILTVDPDAASVNAMYQFGTNYKPVLSFMVPLIPRGAVTTADESIVSNQPKAAYLTITDADTDAADFSFMVTSKMVGATTATFRLIGVSKNAAPSGNIDFDCAMSEFTPGTNTFTAHVTTGEVTALLTPATQNRPVAVTTAAHTINGTLAAGDVVFGSCEVDATATTSAQLTDFRLYGYVLIQLSVNSLSD